MKYRLNLYTLTVKRVERDGQLDFYSVIMTGNGHLEPKKIPGFVTSIRELIRLFVKNGLHAFKRLVNIGDYVINILDAD
jgi:hypothetical protein